MDDQTNATSRPKRGTRRSSTESVVAPSAANDTSFTPSYEGTSANQDDPGFIGRVRERASAQLNTQKDRATDGIGSAVQAVRQSTQQLRDQKHDTVARYIEQAADQLDRFANRIKDKNVNELLDDAQRFARRQPALFIGGAFALGLLGSRFFKSSSPRRAVSGGYGGEYDRAGQFGGTAYRGGGIGTTGTISGTARDLPGTETF